MTDDNCKDNKFKLCFKLKQHTPLIHFQSNQTGATLRATELKPKLDRFLLKKLGNGNYENGKKIAKSKKWLIGKGEHPALDYKVRIANDTSEEEKINDRHPLFFANMGKSDNEKIKIMYSKDNKPEIVFISFNQELLEYIKKSFSSFLAQTNFGIRQSKGFGSFYLENEKFDISNIPYKVYSFSSSNWQEDISIFYQFLRQGINRPKFKDKKPVLDKKGCTVTRFYCKPFIYVYANDKQKTWEKREIKQKYFSNNLKKQAECKKNPILTENKNPPYLLRELFGLSTSQFWKSYDANITKESIEKNEKGEPLYARFKSPITFKVIENTIYFWVNDSYKKFLNKEFLIQKNGYGDLKLKTPPDFNFDDFFKELLKIDLSNHIEEKYHKDNKLREYEQLEKIFNSLLEVKK